MTLDELDILTRNKILYGYNLLSILASSLALLLFIFGTAASIIFLLNVIIQISYMEGSLTLHWP